MNVLSSIVEAGSDDRTYQIRPSPQLGRNPTEATNKAMGMTLVEVVVALAISSIAVAGIVSGYLFSVTSAEKSALSLAASARASERLEQTHSAKWDLSSWPSVDQLVETNFPDEVVILDLNGTGKEITYATNMTSISQISKTPPLKEIHVDCVWSFKGGQLVTNSVETCRAPDQ
jgi:prepilin-type N-terminal cleavage/methylation domain-containing protein